jgi:hypothetical protein
MGITVFLESFPATYQSYTRLRIRTRGLTHTVSGFHLLLDICHLPLFPLPISWCHGPMKGLTTSKECPHILGQPELFRILTQHLFGQLLENSGNRFNLLFLLVLNG